MSLKLFKGKLQYGSIISSIFFNEFQPNLTGPNYPNKGISPPENPVISKILRFYGEISFWRIFIFIYIFYKVIPHEMFDQSLNCSYVLPMAHCVPRMHDFVWKEICNGWSDSGEQVSQLHCQKMSCHLVSSFFYQLSNMKWLQDYWRSLLKNVLDFFELSFGFWALDFLTTNNYIFWSSRLRIKIFFPDL